MAAGTISYRAPDALVQTDWLEAHLLDSELRILDCTLGVNLLPLHARDTIL